MSMAEEATMTGPGATLRAARTERQISVDRAAAALRLSPRQVAALEADDFDQLPGPTYVRGYLRNYAQYLGIPAEPLIAAFNELPAAARRVEFTAREPEPQLTSSHALVRLGTVLVAGVVLGLAAIWWAGKEAGPPATVSSEERAADSAEPMAEAAAPVSPSEPEQAATAETPAAATTDAPAVEPAKRPINAVPDAAPVVAPDAPRSRLVLYVHQDSWADVRDARDRRLIYETIVAGRVVTLEGVAPLQVFLGNVDGVRVEFEGRPYDASRHKRGQVARFTLGTARTP